MLYSGPDLSNLVIDYYNTLVERTNSGRPLLHNEQEEFLTEMSQSESQPELAVFRFPGGTYLVLHALHFHDSC